MTVLDTAAQLRSGQLDLREYLDRVCDRIEADEPALQALVPGTYSRSVVLRQAADLLARYPDPASRPPLFGVPIGIKDIFRVDGYPTRCGSSLPAALFEGPEAPCVTRLRDNGAVLIGKTVTTEFAFFEPGPTRNPHNPDHTPGGSSSGSAAGIARGYFLLALGSQTIGSTTRPAGYCGVIGFVPSFGRISTAGVIPLSPSADHVGLFSPDTSALSVILRLLVEGTWNDDDSGLGGNKPVLGVPDGPYLTQADPAALAQFEAHLLRLQKAGYSIKRVKALADIEAINHRHTKMMRGEMARVHADWFKPYQGLYRPRTAAAITEGFGVSDQQLAEHRAGRSALRAELEGQMKSEGIDCWISPSATGPAPKGLDSTGNPFMSLPWTHAGLPTISIPAGVDSAGLPLGIQLIAPFMRDEILVAIAGPLANVFTIH